MEKGRLARQCKQRVNWKRETVKNMYLTYEVKKKGKSNLTSQCEKQSPNLPSHGLMCKHLTSRSNWNLEMLVFMEGGKPEYPEKNPRSKDENQQQTQPTYDTVTENREFNIELKTDFLLFQQALYCRCMKQNE